MSRATLVYILILLASAAGVMVILERGLTLAAPPDFSGEWNILGDDEDLSASLGRSVVVEQSGEFVRLNFDAGLKVGVKLETQLPNAPGPTTRRVTQMKFVSSTWSLTTLGVGSAGPLSCTLSGPRLYRFTMNRPIADGPDRPAPATSQKTNAS